MPTLPDIDLSTIPEGQRDAVAALLQETSSLKAIIKRLEHFLAELNHVVHGKKSEKLDEDARQLAFEDLNIAISEAEEHKRDQAPSDDTPKRKRVVRRNRGNLPKDLPRIERVIEPGSLLCPCGCGEMHKIGEDRTERLDIVPAQLRVIVTVRPKYACRACSDSVTQAAAPAHLIEGGLPTEGAMAHVLVNKYADHSPSVIGRFQSIVHVQRAGPCFCPWSARHHKMRTVEGGRPLIYISCSKQNGKSELIPSVVPARDVTPPPESGGSRWSIASRQGGPRGTGSIWLMLWRRLRHSQSACLLPNRPCQTSTSPARLWQVSG